MFFQAGIINILVVRLDQGEGSALGKAAHVDTSLNVEIALVTPVLAPWVFDRPEVGSSAIGSESNGKDGMINVLIIFTFFALIRH